MLHLTSLQNNKVQIFYFGHNRNSSTCTRVLQWKIIGLVPCIRILLNLQSKKVPIVLENLSFEALHLYITTGVIPSTKVLIDRFQLEASYSTEELPISFLPSESR